MQFSPKTFSVVSISVMFQSKFNHLQIDIILSSNLADFIQYTETLQRCNKHLTKIVKDASGDANTDIQEALLAYSSRSQTFKWRPNNASFLMLMLQRHVRSSTLLVFFHWIGFYSIFMPEF